MRVFAFANGYGQDGYESSKMSRPFQPRLGIFSDDGLSRLDLVVAAAAKNGLRLDPAAVQLVGRARRVPVVGGPGVRAQPEAAQGAVLLRPQGERRMRKRSFLKFFFLASTSASKKEKKKFNLTSLSPSSRNLQPPGQGRLPGLHLPRRHAQKPQGERPLLLGGARHHGLGADERAAAQ